MNAVVLPSLGTRRVAVPFSVAVGLMNRLRFRSKFAVAGALVALMVGVLALSLFIEMRGSLDVLRQEQTGLVVLDASLDALEAMHRQRAIAAGLEAGAGDALRGKLAEAAEQASQRLAKVAQLLAGDAAKLELEPHWRAVRQAWAVAAAAENTVGHEASSKPPPLEAAIHNYLGDLGDHSNLGLDAATETHYLAAAALVAMSDLVDRVSRLRTRGVVILAQDELAIADGRQLNLDLAQMQFAGFALRNLLERASQRAEDPAVAKHLDAALKEIAASVEGARKTVVSELLQGSLSLPAAHYLDRMSGISADILTSYRTSILPHLKAGLDAREARLQRRIYVGMAVMLVGFLLLGLVAAGVFSGVNRGLRTLVEGAERLGAGDLEHRIALDSSDELADVARGFNGMASAFAGVIREVQRGAADVMAVASGLSELAAQVSCGATQQSAAATEMAAAVEQMTAAIGMTARNAAKANALSQESGRLSAEGGDEVTRSKRQMERIAGVVSTSESVIRDLGQKLAAIGTMVDAISAVAEQTNLLALNASIEAARAGESGRGFAVVADEVRKLAERTAKATQEITSLVEGIESGAERAVSTMRHGVEQVGEGMLQANQASAAMQQIRLQVDEVVDVVGNISCSLEDQDATSGAISRGVEQIARMAEDNNGSVATLAETARKMRDLSSELKAQVQKFRVSV